MRIRIYWGLGVTEDKIVDFIKKGWILQRTPFRLNSLWLRNLSASASNFSSIIIDNVPDKVIAELLIKFTKGKGRRK